MLKTKWCEKTNSVILSEYIVEKEAIVPPRPVFCNELKLLGFEKKFELPNENSLICWAIEKKYFYNGELIAEAKGGNIYSDPLIVYNENINIKCLKPIDVNSLIQQNQSALFIIENEAMDFIRDKFEYYESKVSDFVVAFSGGKDSQVILDLVTRVLPNEKFKVVFTDTGMELPCTIDTIGATEKSYQQKYPELKFFHAESSKKAIDLWHDYGPPSRINRWCCSVLKTALFGRKMKELLDTTGQPRVVVFEGVRSDESARRESYGRVGEGVKHINITNCRPIIKWNTTEVFLYMLARNIQINPAYTFGLTRVGCSVCPFASDWSEFIIRKHYPEITQKYITVIEEMARNIGISKQEKIDHYISSGNWKKNAGGKGLIPDNSRMDIISKEPNFECVVLNPKTDWKKWFGTLGEYLLTEILPNQFKGELKFKNDIIKFDLKIIDNILRFKAYATTNKILLVSLLSKAFVKTAFCECCGVCEIECPTGALRVREDVQIDKTRCTNCNNCFGVNTKGCIIATRKSVFEGGNSMNNPAVKTSGIDKYSTFGLRDNESYPWLSIFFDKMDEWFVGYGGLGSRQIPAMLNWLREAELVELKEKKVTELAKLLKPKYFSNPLLVWQIIWCNLSTNSEIAKWYTRSVRNEVSYSRLDLLENLKEHFPNLEDATLNNPISALLNTFDNSPLGANENDESENNLLIGVLSKSGASIKTVRKMGVRKISPLTVAYLLYKNAELNNTYEVTISDFYEKNFPGVYNAFNLPVEELIVALNTLMQFGVLSADLSGGLDNIHLYREFTAKSVLINMFSRMN